MDGQAHPGTIHNVTAGRRSGQYQALCGYFVSAAALATPVGRSCASCTAPGKAPIMYREIDLLTAEEQVVRLEAEAGYSSGPLLVALQFAMHGAVFADRLDQIAQPT